MAVLVLENGGGELWRMGVFSSLSCSGWWKQGGFWLLFSIEILFSLTIVKNKKILWGGKKLLKERGCGFCFSLAGDTAYMIVLWKCFSWGGVGSLHVSCSIKDPLSIITATKTRSNLRISEICQDDSSWCTAEFNKRVRCIADFSDPTRLPRKLQ